jgi:beta-glucanase (GH16 family)
MFFSVQATRLKYLILLIFPLLFVAASCEDQSGVNDFVFPQFISEDIVVEEGDETWQLSIPVSLDKVSEQTISLSYQTKDGTAISGKDFVAVSGQIFFEPGQTQQEIKVTIQGNSIKEDDKTFEVTFAQGINVSLKTTSISVTLLNDDTELEDSGSLPTTGFISPESYEGYQLVWRDEFEGDEISEDWTFEIGTGSNGWGNNELQYYRRENTTVKDGLLVIEAKRENFSGRQYTSSRIVTQGKQNFKYGRIDVRAALPKGQGIWPAVWMLGKNFPTVSWPFCGEIDIMEMIGGSASGRDNTVHGTIHWAHNGQHAQTGGATTLSSGIFADNFHVFSIIWTPTSIRWLVDDRQFHVVDISPSGLNAFREEFFFIFNVAVGGNWPGSPDSNTKFPQKMAVDYIRVFQEI